MVVEHHKKRKKKTNTTVPSFPKLAQHGGAEESRQMADTMPTQMNDLIEGQRSTGEIRGRIKVIQLHHDDEEWLYKIRVCSLEVLEDICGGKLLWERY